MRMGQVTIFVVIALVLVAGVLLSVFLRGGGVEVVEPEQKCREVGGTWREFPDGCVDSCDAQRNPGAIVCTQAFTFGCDCPKQGECWNGESCEGV